VPVTGTFSILFHGRLKRGAPTARREELSVGDVFASGHGPMFARALRGLSCCVRFVTPIELDARRRKPSQLREWS
jgi:hypothetical protein